MKIYMNIYSGFICNLQKLKATLKKGMDKQTVIYANNGILLSSKWDGATDTCKFLMNLKCFTLNESTEV